MNRHAPLPAYHLGADGRASARARNKAIRFHRPYQHRVPLPAMNHAAGGVGLRFGSSGGSTPGGYDRARYDQDAYG